MFLLPIWAPSPVSMSLAGNEYAYGLTVENYQFTANPCNNYTLQWALIYQGVTPQNSKVTPPPVVVHNYSWNINGGASRSPVYTIDPRVYGQYGTYYVAVAPQLLVSDGESYLDTEEMANTGASVVQVFKSNLDQSGIRLCGIILFFIERSNWNNQYSELVGHGRFILTCMGLQCYDRCLATSYEWSTS